MLKKILLSPLWSVVVLGVLAYTIWLSPNFLQSIQLRYFDQLIISQPKIENNIYTVDIDEATIDAYGQWPFPRGDYADLIIDLYNRGAGLVVFNVLMSEPDRSGEDAILADTMAQLPVVVTILGAEENKNEGCGRGTRRSNYEYARGPGGLDFYALTEHEWQIDPDKIAEYFSLSEEYELSGRFVCLPGYEFTSLNYGHRNIYFRDGSGTIVNSTTPWGPLTTDPNCSTEPARLYEILERHGVRKNP